MARGFGWLDWCGFGLGWLYLAWPWLGVLDQCCAACLGHLWIAMANCGWAWLCLTWSDTGLQRFTAIENLRMSESWPEMPSRLPYKRKRRKMYKIHYCFTTAAAQKENIGVRCFVNTDVQNKESAMP